MRPDHCLDCGEALPVPPTTAGVCPLCGGRVEKQHAPYQLIEPIPEAAPHSEARRRHARTWGGVQLVTGSALLAYLVSLDRPSIMMSFAAGMLAAHGLYRLVFGGGPNRGDDDYDGARGN